MCITRISLPSSLRIFVDQQIEPRGYSSLSEYICELIRKDQDRQRLHTLLLASATSAPAVTADTHYSGHLRGLN